MMKKKPVFFRLFFLFILSTLFLLFLVSSSYSELIKVASDPVRTGVGARTLGMGKMGMSLADDCNAIFLNPAGISQLSDWQVMSMTGQFLNEINYLQFGGVYKTDFGTFGLGYVGASLGADFAKPMLISFEGEWRVIASSEGYAYSYNDAVFLLTYGARLRDLFDWDWTKDLSVGTNLKVFTLGLSGTNIYGGTGTGFDMDIGILYKPLTWLSAGFTGQNILPHSAGGKISWATGQEESIPSLVKLGVSARIIGRDSPYEYGEHELLIGLDSDFSLTNPELPALLHLGAEWWPIEYVALRAGIDQDYVGTGTGALETTNNLTAGVGLLYSGFRFDYAYHQYNEIPENDTHWFSLSYNIWKEKPPLPPASMEYLRISEPAAKSTAYADKVRVVGQVLNADAKKVTVNDVNVELSPGGSFAIEVPVKMGKNALRVVAFDGLGNSLEVKKLKVLRLITFKDVPSNYWAKEVIEDIATLGIVTGYPDGTFRPEGPITRAEVTTLLVRALGQKLPEAVDSVFSDLPSSHWAAKYVKEGVRRKYVLGYPDGTFKPSNRINKAEGVVLMSRFGELKTPEKVIEAPFADLPGRHWAATYVTSAKQAGYLKYLEGKPFEPKKDLTRAEAVEILSRTKFAKGKIAELKDYSKGY
jgi:hypothetical protein